MADIVSNDYKLDFSDVMIVPGISHLNSRKEVNLLRTFKFKNGVEFEVCPIIAANMDTVGTFSMLKRMEEHNMMVALHKHYSIEKYKEFFLFYNGKSTFNYFITVGTSKEERVKFNDIWQLRKKCNLNKDFPVLINIDIANGYIPALREAVEYYKRTYPNSIISAGNVCTPEGVRLLSDAGADIAKIGISGGSLCITRAKTGVGYPQFSMILECREEADKRGVYLISDGGCTCPGDIAKAFGAGADFVMLGGMLAGHDECEVEFYRNENGEEYCISHGMSSTTAMMKYNGNVPSHRTSEGRTVPIKAKGPVNNTLLDIEGGLRSCGTYIGAETLEKFAEKASFVKVYHQLNTSLVK